MERIGEDGEDRIGEERRILQLDIASHYTVYDKMETMQVAQCHTTRTARCDTTQFKTVLFYALQCTTTPQ